MTDSKCYAAIDIGSNAVRLLIKKVKNNENLANKRLSKVMLLRVPLRLGFDVFSLGEVSDAKVMKLRRLMKAFRQLMKIYEVTNYRACATSAMRDAQNGKSVIKMYICNERYLYLLLYLFDCKCSFLSWNCASDDFTTSFGKLLNLRYCCSNIFCMCISH